MLSVPIEGKNIQRTLIIVAENNYDMYYTNFFWILEKSNLVNQYKILNNLFLAFENMALIEKDREFEAKNKKRAGWFLEELTNDNDLLRDNMIEFI